MRRWLERSAILVAMGCGAWPAGGSVVTWRELLVFAEPAEGLLAAAEDFAEVVPASAAPVAGVRPFTEVLKALVETHATLPQTQYFFCTVYYTPRESGFTAERGFDMTPGTRRGLKGRNVPSDFLRTVTVEGFGRLAEPVDGRPFLAYDGAVYTRILGNRNNTLMDRRSIAVHRRNPLFGKGTQVTVLDPGVQQLFGGTRFEVGDTGGGLFRSQIDLYWGEDDPLGPGPDVLRPAACAVAVAWIVPVWVWP